MSKKTKVGTAIFSVLFCLGALWVGSALKTNAANPPVITNIKVNYFNGTTGSISWLTDITTTGKLEYGKTSGHYKETSESSPSSTSHAVYLKDLSYDTTYYFKITVTDANNNSAESTEQSFTTETKAVTITSIAESIGYDKAVIEVNTNKITLVKLKYGTVSSSLDKEAAAFHKGCCTDIYPAGYHAFVINGLESESKYYYKAYVYEAGTSWSGDWPASETTSSEVKSLTSTGVPVINNISPTSGPVGTILTITGQNFGQPGGLAVKKAVSVGCDLGIWPDGFQYCLADIISWSDSKIEARIKSGAQTGTVYVAKTHDAYTWENINFFTIKGPVFTLTAGTATNTNTAVVSCVSEAYGCKYSTTNQDNETVQVKTLFTQDSETDNYLERVYEAYYTAWSRYPRCDELQFHLDHATPIERLKSWLAESSITEKYGCKFSTTISDADTVRLTALFKLDSETDKYLNDVYNTYYNAWGRYPRCDELEFHATRQTPLTRLADWLELNKPTEIKEVELEKAYTSVKIEFKDFGSTVILKDPSAELQFTVLDTIMFSGLTDSNALVVLTLTSNTEIYTTSSDSQGNWSYTLPGPLEAGNHTVKVAVFNDNNEKLRESETINFSVSDAEESANTNTAAETAETNYLLWGGIILVAVVIVIILAAVLNKGKTAAKK